MNEAMIKTNLVKEETKIESICDEETLSEEIINKEDDELKLTKEAMGQVREENERLKIKLSKLMKSYHSLRTHFFHIAKQEPTNQPGKTLNPTHQEEDHDLLSLTLGRHIITNLSPHKNEKKIHILNEEEKHNDDDDDKFASQGLKLGLDCRFEPTLNGPMIDGSSNEIGVEEKQQDEESKSLKTMRSGDDGFLQHTQLKRARVSVRARCDTPTMNDGCQWRKYGQKISKGNPCPRAYYRCTISTTCPVRKQAQRCANDMSILITTYEGTHNHPLPISATAMASTTSAAASMLPSGSSSSTSQASYDTPVNTTTTTSGAASSFHGSKNMLPQHLFNFANSSISTLNSHPTITLDLTSTASQQQPVLQNFYRFSSLPKYPANSLNFSSTPTTSCLESFSTNPWGNSYLSYDRPSYNRSNEAPSQAQLYEGHYMQTNNQNRYQMLPTLTENTLAAATKEAISRDPNFRSVIEAAITSLVSNNGSVGKSSQNLKRGCP